MDIKQLYYFTSVVQEKTISAAAKKLHISQPPLSTTLKQLENELNTTLFVRGKREIQVTESGKFLYKEALSILDIYNNIIKNFTENTSFVSECIRIGMISSSEAILLDKIIFGFHQEYPDIRFEIIEGNTYQLLEKLNTHLLDAALIRTPFEDNNFSRIMIQSEPLVAIGDQSYFSKTTDDYISFSSLGEYPLIVYRRWTDILKKEFTKRNMNPTFICINDDARTSMAWIDKKMGVGIVPASSLSLSHNTSVCIKKISDFTLNTDICCMFSPKSNSSNAAQILHDYLNDIFA